MTKTSPPPSSLFLSARDTGERNTEKRHSLSQIASAQHEAIVWWGQSEVCSAWPIKREAGGQNNCTRVAAAASRYPLAHSSGLTMSRWDRKAMVTTTRRALPLSSQSRLQHSPNTKHTVLILSSRTRTAAVCDMSLLIHEIDGSEGEDNTPRVKRTRRAFPRPTYNASFACADMLWRGEPVRVRCRPTAVVDLFRENLAHQTNCNSGFIVRVVDPILPVRF